MYLIISCINKFLLQINQLCKKVKKRTFLHVSFCITTICVKLILVVILKKKYNMRDSILIYRSHVESISMLNDTELELQIYKAIFSYCLDNVEPKLTGVGGAIFTSIKVNLDNAMKRYDTSVENGKKGGRPKKVI